MIVDSQAVSLRLDSNLKDLQRKKNQIDYIAREVIKKWHFCRKDNMVMTAAAKDCAMTTWSGSSTWEEERWVRDETKPETNEYYVKTVVFRPNQEIASKNRIKAERAWCPSACFNRSQLRAQP